MITKTIKSFLYWEYNDDAELQAFIDSYNIMTQEYIDFFNAINLPIYTSNTITGSLLDWVAQGIYGLSRPSIGVFLDQLQGTYNTYKLNTTQFNRGASAVNYTLTDDQYKRLITWHFYKGDGKVFSITWLKRRIERFLFGINGTDYNNPTYRISVSFLDPSTVLIFVPMSVFRMQRNSSGFNCFKPNGRGSVYNGSNAFSRTILPVFTSLTFFKQAIDAKILELPFQFNFIVNTG